MSKLKKENQDIVDNQLDKLVVKLNPTFKKIGFTPNGITTLSFIFGILAVYFLQKSNTYTGSIFAGLFYFISYFFDCQDGNFARTYKMYSKFGDLYDHISDAIILIGLVYILWSKPISYKYHISILLTITGVLCWLYYKKQEEYYDVLKNDPDHIDKVDMSSMKYLRYFGPGCMALFITIIIMISPSLLK